jgi:hypothetical protein
VWLLPNAVELGSLSEEEDTETSEAGPVAYSSPDRRLIPRQQRRILDRAMVVDLPPAVADVDEQAAGADLEAERHLVGNEHAVLASDHEEGLAEAMDRVVVEGDGDAGFTLEDALSSPRPPSPRPRHPARA